MTTSDECVCCMESKPSEIVQQYNEINGKTISCIINHPGFQNAVLDPWVLQIAYMAYRQHHGALNRDIHRQFRYTAYRQLTRWCWGYLGRDIRVRLPSCATQRIRATYPDASGTYCGFKFPAIDCWTNRFVWSVYIVPQTVVSQTACLVSYIEMIVVVVLGCHSTLRWTFLHQKPLYAAARPSARQRILASKIIVIYHTSWNAF